MSQVEATKRMPNHRNNFSKETRPMKKQMPIRDMMASESFYKEIDPGIRFAVRVLHAKGFETCQSCQGGKGHSYDHPTIDLVAGGDDAKGFGAVAALRDYGLPVAELQIVWPMMNGLPFEKLWRIVFIRDMKERAAEIPMFIYGYHHS
jgi:hypothetical protein